MSARIEIINDFDIWYMYEKEGMTQREIADYYGVSRGCIYYRLYPEKQKKYNDNRKYYLKEWLHSDNGKLYEQSDNRKKTKSKHNSKRRGLGHVMLNKPFENSDAHHIDEVHIIYMPADLHRSISHNVWTGQGMEEINAIAFRYITEEMFDKLIEGRM